jgi:hypothetical protein
MMRVRKLSAVLAIPLIVGAAGCRRTPEKLRAGATEEETPARMTMLHVADPRAAVQLVKGFHDVEQHSWRWTMGKFAVVLRPPANASRRGARLVLRCTVPAVVVQRLTAVRLTATVGGLRLPEETYSKPGEYVYSYDVPAKVLTTDAVMVEFALDKHLAPEDADQRELGIVVSMAGFEAK